MTIVALCISMLKLPFQDQHAVRFAEGLLVATCLCGGNLIRFRLAHVPYAL